MTRNHYKPGKVNPHLPHDGVEIEGPPPSDASDMDTAMRNADLLVSQLMLGSTKPGSKSVTSKALPKVKPNPRLEAAHAPREDVVKKKPRPAEPIRSEPVTKREEPRVKTQARTTATPAAPQKAAPAIPQKPVELRNEAEVTDTLRGAFPALEEEEHKPSVWQRISPVYTAALACGLIVLIWPTLLFWMLVTSCGLLLGFSGLMKLPGISKTLSSVWHAFAQRKPRKAERIRKVADRIAMGLENVLDVLPGSLADHLALPDFSKPVAPKR